MATTSTARRSPSRSPLVPLLAAAVLVLTAACIVLAVLLWRKPADTAGGGGEVRAPAPAKAEGAGAKPEPPARAAIPAVAPPKPAVKANRKEWVSGVVECHGAGPEAEVDDLVKGRVKRCTPVVQLRLDDGAIATCIFPDGPIENLVQLTEAAPVGRRVTIAGRCSSRGQFLLFFDDCELIR